MTGDVSARRCVLRAYRDSLHFKPITRLFVLFSNLESIGTTWGILRTRGDVNKITGPFLHIKPSNVFGNGQDSSKEMPAFRFYLVGDMRSVSLLSRSCFLLLTRAWIKNKKSRRCRRAACERERRRSSREAMRDRFSRRCAAPTGDVTV